MSRELLQQALDALEHQASFVDGYYAPIPAADEAAAAIRAHLAAQPAPVPVARVITNNSDDDLGSIEWLVRPASVELKGGDLLYTHSAAPVPVPFTKAQLHRLYVNSPEHHKDAPSEAAFTRIVQLAEAAHGIAASPEVPRG